MKNSIQYVHFRKSNSSAAERNEILRYSQQIHDSIFQNQFIEDITSASEDDFVVDHKTVQKNQYGSKFCNLASRPIQCYQSFLNWKHYKTFNFTRGLVFSSHYTFSLEHSNDIFEA